MNERDFKKIVRGIFRQLGLDPRDIPRKENCLTPDFEVVGKDSKYTVELKIKDDDPEELSRETQMLLSGGVVEQTIPLGPRNTLAGLIREGIRQILAHDQAGNSFRVIWLHSSGQDPEVHYQRFYATLFGSETLFSLTQAGLITFDCFYFYESAFYSWREYLDGAILTYYNNAQLCINTLSPRVKEFRQSELVQGLSQALCDPDRLDSIQSKILIADCQDNRAGSQRILEHLKQKYKLEHLQTIPMQKHTGKILVK